MASSPTNALKHWARLIQQWPVDKVRPETVSFQRVMQYRIQNAGRSLPGMPPLPAQKRDPKAPAVELRVWEENKELRQTNILYTFLENKLSKQYPMPQSLRYPASDSNHYDDVVAEMSAAPTRSWLSNMMKRLKGSLRLT